MKSGDKASHPHWGEVTIVEPGELETLVELAGGEVRGVTTKWLSPSDEPKQNDSKPAAV